MKNAINTVMIGGSGIVASSVTGEIIPTSTSDIASITQLIIQIAIGIATLFGLFRKKKVAINSNKQ